MNQMVPRAALVCVVVLAGAAQAQVGRNYDVMPLNFDLWCQETAHIAPDRCDKRLPQDNDAFEAYRAKMDAYEIPYLKQKNKDARIETQILHNDPTDRSPTRALQAQSQQGSQAPVRNEAVP
ncbi:MAG: hypothetical protein JO256_05010 [Alphaproteobacteria bacterium]|nr:hypothetical protein [Alphaproteobacteria bacterium]